MNKAEEKLTEYVMHLLPRIRVWKVGSVRYMEYRDVVGEYVTVGLNQVEGE